MSENEPLWQEICISALLGTQRHPFQPRSPGGALGEIIQAVQHEAAGQPSGSEWLLLRAAAVTALHRRAGRLPMLANPDGLTQLDLLPPCPIEQRPRCSTQAGACLEQITISSANRESSRAVFLPEWVETAFHHGQRAREEHLPALLSLPKLLQKIPREKLLAVLGERGRWLAAQNPTWSFYARFSEENTWYEGQRKNRSAFLSDLRSIDPNHARELLASTWSQETPAERVTWLEILSTGLSMADEPFLESVLDDRRKDVRQAAAALLAALPDSRLVRRMMERASHLVTWRNNLLRSKLLPTSIEVKFPETCDAAMQRDGIEPHPPARWKLGEKAWWLVQILSLVPPRAWSKAWNKHPGQILDLLQKNSSESILLEGWTAAAVRCQDVDWLEALMMYELRRGNTRGQGALFPKLPAALQEQLLIPLLEKKPSLSYEQPASIYLAACRHSWSAGLTRAVTGCICTNLQRGGLHPWRWEKLLRGIAPSFHPDLLAESIEQLTSAVDTKETGDPFVQELIAALEFRMEIQRAFQTK